MATFTRLTGNAVIFGTTDADLITTGAGDDLILAGAGANTIIAGDGANLIIAAAGDDVITTGLGNDTILAGAGNNRIRAGAGANTIVTGSGNDNIASGNGNDFIDAGAGNNLIDAGDGVNNITTGLGNDSITSGSGNDTINAGAGTNVINAGDGANNITTGAGNDTITSGSGNDAINAGAGNNIVNAGDGTNTVTTGAGNDTLSTGAGNDNINAGDGVNSVSSGAGSDVVTTGAGADTVDAGRGSDVVRSGAGNDVIVHRIAENLGFVDQYDGGAGQDSLRLDLSSAEWARADVQADVAAFLARANPAASFRFNSSKVTVVNVERLEVFVEGVRLANPANEAVRAVADSLSITDGSSVSSINLLLNDGVPDRATSVTLLDISPLEVSPLGASTLGTATLVTSLDGAVQTATLNFVPDASLQSLAQGQSLSETLQYRVQDVNGDFSIGNVTITVTGTNDAPVALDDAAITREGTSVSIAVLANDSDPERDPLTITQVADRPIAIGSPVTLSDPSTSATLGQVALTPTGELVFTPAPGFSGPVEFTYTVSDGSATDQGLVNISVDAVNDPPDARDDLITGNEDTTLNFRPEANDSKVDGQPPRITAINGIPIELRDPPIQLTNGIVYKAPAVPQGSTELQFRPNANFNGEQTFEYTISDGRGGTDTATVTIQVAPVNDSPAGGDAAATVTEGDAYTLTARDFGFSDPDVGDSLKAVRIDSLPTKGTLQLNGSPVTALALVTAEQIAAGALKFVPDAGENGSPYGSFRFSVQDQSNAFDPVPNTFTLNVIGSLTVNSVLVNEGDIATFTVGIPGSAEPTLIKLAVSTADPRFTAEDADLAPPGALVVSFVGPVGDVITLMPAADGTYTVPAGVTRLQVGVPTVQDQVNEGPETFGLTVTSTSPTVSNGTVGVTAEGRINDQEGPGSDLPVIGISVSSAPVGEEGPAVLLYTVAITNGKTSEFPTVVNYTVGGSALEGVDYLAPSRSVSIPAGETFTSFRVAAFDDSVFEGRETVVVTLQSASSNGLSLPLANTVATGSIDDSSGPGSDKPIVGINVAPALVQEDGPANLVYTVAITNGKTSNASTEVSFTLTGTATAGADYGPVTRTVTIPPGENSATFVVDPFGDLAFEGNETVVATLVSASTAGVPLGLDPARTAAVGTIVDNDLLSQGTVPTAQEAALSTGTSPTLNTELVTGRMAGSDAANPNFSWRLGAPPAGIIKSGGANVLWATSADGKSVTGTVSEIVNGTVTVKPIATLTINDAGDYSFSLQGPVDHPAGGAPNQALAINFSATASPGGAGGVTATVPLTINVQDDQPQQPVAPAGLSATIANTNLMFVLDLSGSMNEPSGIPGLSRLQAAVDSIIRLIDKYDALGETTVRLVTFNNEAAVRNAFVDSDVFVNLSNPSQKQGWNDLLQVIRNSPPSNFGNANHDAALATAISAWDAGGKIAGAQNVAYFLASSLPTAAKGSAASLVGAFNQDASDLGIQPSEEAAWTTFLAARNLQSHAIGIGPGIATGAAALAPVAYDGQAEENRNGQIVTDLTQLDTVLNDTLPRSIQGKLVGSLTTGGAGADGGLYLKSVVIGGETYSFTPDASGVGGSLSAPLPPGSSFDSATASLTVASTAGVGAKLVIDFDGGSYSFDSPAMTGTESIVYTVADRDGDVSSPASLQIQVDAATASVIGDDFGNQLSGDARVNTVFGKGGDDVLLGVGGNDRLFGNAGNDNLDGGDGNDDLSGGAGTDQLLGGPGNDKLSGGIGSDVFAWRFADQGAPGAGRALDTIDDFNVAPVAQGGDVLDLRDLLIGEAQGVNGSAGNLQGFLDILVVGGSTEIRVSTAGGFTGGNYGTGTAEDQRITLTGVNLSTGLVPGQTLSEAQIIENLLRNGKLITD